MTNAEFPKQRFWLAGKREPAQDLFFRETLARAAWLQGDADDWDSCWYTGMPAPEVFEQLTPGKTINHIPGNSSLTIKSNLHATLAAARDRMRELDSNAGDAGASLSRRLDFFPRIYSMPLEYHAFQEAAWADPGRQWILKPKNSARGKGIAMISDTGTVPLDKSWMVQDYLGNPHTMNGHKYVLRLYVLVSSVEPLRVYLYNEGSAKLASAAYDPDDLSNPYAHLTNPDLNANNTDSESPVVFISFRNYRAWLREQGHDDEALFASIRDLVALTLIAAREKMRDRLNAVKADTAGCYELLGLDCLVDATLKPWILECNLSPSLDICAAPKDGGDIEATTKRRLVEDTVRLLGIDAPWIDRSDLQPMARIRAEAEAELARCGQFTRVYPTADAASYLPFFPLPRLADMVLADAVTQGKVARPMAAPRQTAELITDQGLSLYDDRTGTLFSPNATAAWIWLRAGGGTNPDTIADELLASQPDPTAEKDWQVRQDVWNLLADWAEAGLLLQQPPTLEPAREPAEPDSPAAARMSAPEDMTLAVGTAGLRLHPGHWPVAQRLQSLLSPLETAQTHGDRLEILQASPGYAITGYGRLLANGLKLSRIGPVVCDLLRKASVRNQNACALAGVLVPMEGVKSGNNAAEPVPAVFVAQHGKGAWDVAALYLAARLGHGHAGGMTLALDGSAAVTPVGLPARIGKEDGLRLEASCPVHEWPSGEQGHLLPAAQSVLAQAHEARQACQVNAVVVPMHSGHGPGEPTLKALTEHQVLAVLLPAAMAGTGDILDADAVGQLAAWLTGRQLWSLDTADLGTGIDALTGHLLAGPAASDGSPATATAARQTEPT